MSNAVHGESPHDRVAERGVLSADELDVLAERTAQELLGVSAAEAFAMLDRGELAGTVAESALEGIRFVMAS
jgi:hypothetical protein